MSKEMASAVRELLEQIEAEAESSYAEGSAKIFNDKIWKKYDPTLFGLCNKIKKLMKRDGL